ncbi:NAD(P)/FAD-dependent oxidoreductase [Candidatus Bathyarchaeota archaeon]|nr:NAD(P)/FAD-dependent oxidoreductase [Candidatus Bathyarchaeota archaeon]
MKHVIIVGGGPAGLFAAEELAKNFQVTLLEKTSHVGGSGLVSDGKLNYHPKIGGDLTNFLTERESWNLIESIRLKFESLSVPSDIFDESKLRQLEVKAAKSGIRFIKIKQTHIGSDHLGEVIDKLRKKIENAGVQIIFNAEVHDIVVKGRIVTAVKVKNELYPLDALLIAPGRIGSPWLISTMNKHNLAMQYNPIDIGVRVEVPNEVMDEVVNVYGCWDPKFHIDTASYDDFVRTFCVCPRGFVVKEAYEDTQFGVNGYSNREMGSNTTNFALLVNVNLTEPLENTTEYGRRIVQLANTLGGRRPILQRLGDLRSFRRSTWDRINRSYVRPSYTEVTPGDISMAYPHRIVKDLLEGLEALDRVMPGINSDSTLLYAPEVKFYAMRIQTNKELRTSIPNLFVAGDGAGVSRGIVGAAATGLIAAKGITKNLTS